MWRLLNNPQLRPQHYLGGVAVLLCLLWVYFNALQMVFWSGESYSWQDIWQDVYVRHVIKFSFGQAFLSALLSVIIGVIFARALFYQSFYGKRFLLKLFSLTFVLPALVAIFGVIGIYGNQGWLARSAVLFGIDFQPHIYGLTGILITHLFFNIPLAARMFLQALQTIPVQSHQLAAQLNLRSWYFIRLLEWPYIKQQIFPAFALIFMLCFTSFTIVLTLGGGPQYTTLEVAIYQAIVFDFDLSKAGMYALLQFVFCFVLFGINSVISPMSQTTLHQRKQWQATQGRAVKIWQFFVIVCVSLFLVLPLLNTVVQGLFSEALWTIWSRPQLWRALGYSLSIAPLSALCSLLMASALLLLSRRLYWLHWYKTAHMLLNTGMLILAVPTLLLAIGLFLWSQQVEFATYHLFIIVVFCNALAAMPFVIRILAVPMNNNMIYYEKLCQSLGIQGWARLRWVEWAQLAQPMKYAFALACALSLGDFTAIAMFGNHQFTSLPHLLYQQLGSYRGDEAAVTALILLVICLGIFQMVEKNRHDSIK
ncbi:thiamine/thiamine pyrophosphate ABC transporter permease ThiP [Conservatibacter flavescens]|uniref:Thiamine transport system permease protein ThiP n=1 Tax=Conservatibacter flavescens TaxID=28161 RepID=A0A2M8S3W7_9PAST|nr:thiamine/thiamine pyrophosphate ABC transporter permease ThiP [Conservatibacter flavescens]PJG85845.1 thiamine/thiamine pyrophosphate ABC transporter permease ThiP [Conservatibacter flavescens]